MRTLFSAGTIDRINLLVSRRNTSNPSSSPLRFTTNLRILQPNLNNFYHLFFTFSCVLHAPFDDSTLRVTRKQKEKEKHSFHHICINNKRDLFRGGGGISEIGDGIEDSSEVSRGFSMIFIEDFRGEEKKKEKKK